MIIDRETGNHGAEGAVLANLGTANIVLGNYHRAIEILNQRLQIARELGDVRGEAKTLYNLSFAYYELGEQERALTDAKKALAILERFEDPYTERISKNIKEWIEKPRVKTTLITPSIENQEVKNIQQVNQYQLDLARWAKLPWWKRLFISKPIPPISNE